MPHTQYNLHLKGFVGGADFDRNYVDHVLSQNAGKDVNVLIDSRGGNLATALSIAAAFKNHGKVSDHFVGMNASAATIASLGAAHISIDKNAMYLVHKCSTALHNQGGGSAMLVQARHCVRLTLDFGDLTITAEVEARLEELGFTPETLIDAIGEHKSGCEGNPSIYCGTYGKYSGEKGICGLWIDLTTFYDYDAFVNFCYAIHADEEDPEQIFQDYEGFPRQWYNEGFMSKDDFAHILEYSDMGDLARYFDYEAFLQSKRLRR